MTAATPRLVFMGVSGCGKSSLAAAVAADQGLALVEGDSYHAAQSLDKMKRGVPLTDADRERWLDVLAGLLAAPGPGMAMTCSALKRRYRERLRAAQPGLRFVFLDLDAAEAQRRVAARSREHFFPPALVASQFDVLERPDGEPGVLRVDATAPLERLRAEVAAWLAPAPSVPAARR